MFEQHRVVIRGGGDLGSGVALRLWRAGFPVIVLETGRPIAVRRTVAFSEAVYDGRSSVEEAVGVRSSTAEAPAVLERRHLPVLIDPDGESLRPLGARVVVDAILAKRNTGTGLAMAPLVVALGPGFRAGESAHAVVETNRGPNLGRVIWDAEAEPNTGRPAPVRGIAVDRVLRAPRAGRLEPLRAIGDIVEKDEPVARISGAEIPAPFRGMLRGMAREGLQVSAGMKIGDVDPRTDPELCRRASDKALAVAGGVLEAVLVHLRGSSR